MRILLDLIVSVSDEALCQASDELCCGGILFLFNFLFSRQISDWFDPEVLLFRGFRSWTLLGLVLGSDLLLGALLFLHLIRWLFLDS